MLDLESLKWFENVHVEGDVPQPRDKLASISVEGQLCKTKPKKKKKQQPKKKPPTSTSSYLVFTQRLDIYGGFGPQAPKSADEVDLDADDDEEDEEDEEDDDDERGPSVTFGWFGDLRRLELVSLPSSESDALHLRWWIIPVAGARSPTPRAGTSLAYAGDGKALLFGGRDSTARQGDLWALQLPPSYRNKNQNLKLEKSNT